MITTEERYDFTSASKRNLVLLAVAGLILAALGVFMASGSSHRGARGGKHEAMHAVAHTIETHVDDASRHAPHTAGGHHGSPIWLKQVYSSLWLNNIFFVGLGIIGLFFVAVQYASQAGWSASINRIPLAMASWIPVSGLLTLALWFVVKQDVFHWTHAYLYVTTDASYDKIIAGKQGYFFWPLAGGGFPAFYVIRLVAFFLLWYLFFIWIRREILAEDTHGGEAHWRKTRALSAVFLVIFAVTSSVAAWDWVMSIDTHWFSTMMGWYVFSSWWVAGLAMITLIVSLLKDKGYLQIVNAEHLHDLGKFIFAFSIFWTYIWFSQFMLIYYANLPEESVYFVTRLHHSPYGWIFYINLLINFILPFLLLMTRNSKRHTAMLKMVCLLVLVGHWFDFYNMITPGVMQRHGGIGFLDLGLTLVYLAAFLFVSLSALAKAPLIASRHPMLEESIHHHT